MASNTIYISIVHTKDKLNQYFDILDEVFSKIHKHQKKGLPIINILDGEQAIVGFRNNNKN